MINLPFAQRENIGFQYVLDALKPCSPYGEERVRELKPFEPCQKPELQRQLSNIQRVLTVLEAQSMDGGKANGRPRGPVCDLPEMQTETDRLRRTLEQDEDCQKALDKLLLERQHELALEGWSRQDLIRFGKYTRAWWAKDEGKPYMKLLPIPDIRRGDNPKLGQNDGY